MFPQQIKKEKIDMDKNKQLDKIRGSLVGGAVGDALGYPVEFIYSYKDIQAKYGENGITKLDATHRWTPNGESGSKAWISDDTQMTLFTACGLLNAKATGSAPLPSICSAYIEWLYTQKGYKSERFSNCWVGAIPELNQRRAPGTTCITALEEILRGHDPINSSKGCGGVMRIAPIPLYGVAQGRIANIEALDRMAADASKLTHLHPLGYIPAALLAHVIYRLAANENPTRERLMEYISEGMEACRGLFAEEKSSLVDLQLLVDKAMMLSKEDLADVEAIGEIGEGWVAEETVAIALYCALKYFDNFEKALIAAVNHKGDSDSTGAVTGNILGAALGYDAIPQHFKDDLELHDVILHVADDLYRGETTKYK